MTIQAQLDELKHLTKHLATGVPARHGAIPWASPVLMFGALSRSRVATLGLNPSNLEFVDRNGDQLEHAQRRFHSLSSLGLRRWVDAQPKHLERVWDLCEAYFQRNPYDGWFKPLDRVLSGLGVSYYDEFQPACHLDLVPYATADKWSVLTQPQRQQLGIIGAASLVQLLRASDIRVLVLNGMSVVREFSSLLGVSMSCREMQPWLLPNKKRGVKGYAYELRISSIHGKNLRQEIVILGYNHNIQSSYGVCGTVVSEIANWVAEVARGVEL
jgi:hypothetical protein